MQTSDCSSCKLLPLYLGDYVVATLTSICEHATSHCFDGASLCKFLIPIILPKTETWFRANSALSTNFKGYWNISIDMKLTQELLSQTDAASSFSTASISQDSSRNIRMSRTTVVVLLRILNLKQYDSWYVGAQIPAYQS